MPKSSVCSDVRLRRSSDRIGFRRVTLAILLVKLKDQRVIQFPRRLVDCDPKGRSFDGDLHETNRVQRSFDLERQIRFFARTEWKTRKAQSREGPKHHGRTIRNELPTSTNVRARGLSPVRDEDREVLSVNESVAADVRCSIRCTPRAEHQCEILSVDESVCVHIAWVRRRIAVVTED